jgi:hypothetical protein
MRVNQRRKAGRNLDSRHHRKDGRFSHPKERYVPWISCVYSDIMIILIDYQQTSHPAASPVNDNKIPSHASIAQHHFAVIVPITPRTPKKPSSTSQTIGNPPAVDADSTSNPAAASPVQDTKMPSHTCTTQNHFAVIVPITPRTPKESRTEKQQDAVQESQSVRFEDFRHIKGWKGMAQLELQEMGVEREDNVDSSEEKSSNDDGEGSVAREIVSNGDGNMVDREGTRVDSDSDSEVEDPDSLEAPYLEVCTTKASISILFCLL